MKYETLLKTLGFSLMLQVPAWASPTPISQCGATITDDGHYELVADLVCPNTAASAVRILGTKYVTLKLNGHTIRFLGPVSPLPFPSPGRYRKLGTGIEVNSSEHVRIEGVGSIKNARYGVRLVASEDVDVKKVQLSQNKVGLALMSQSEDTEVEDTSFASNGCDIGLGQGSEAADVEDSYPALPSYCTL